MFFGQLVFRFCLPHKCNNRIVKGSTGGSRSLAPGGTARWEDWEQGMRGRKREGIHTWKTRVALSVSEMQVLKERKRTVNIHGLETNL